MDSACRVEACHVTQETRVQSALGDVANNDDADHVIACNAAHETRVQSALDDVASNIHQALKIGDLMKFEIMYHFGGLYMDTNIELLRDPTQLFTVAASLNKVGGLLRTSTRPKLNLLILLPRVYERTLQVS